MLRNEVSGCRASGVFLRLSAHGLIADNNIHSNGEAGLDIRKGANPIILVTPHTPRAQLGQTFQHPLARGALNISDCANCYCGMPCENRGRQDGGRERYVHHVLGLIS